ncbi:hypothetical protein [Paraburkholderia solisilvae]|uniref:Uncharacterized protein n=1 Tax=Paraburkholderia solisilvae TaxID=624376 RepID=A0A6J5DH62_9BURK|nr:hypothetical protein [Paraburkholderia solisilvae]CAB3752797.1 hypothetical protein LMG29739_01588 [Paraburkholderia solisilvae]
MSKLYLEDIVDVNTPYPYVFVYMLEENEIFSPGQFAPFMDLAVQRDRSLRMTVFESANPVSLTLEQWNEIARVAREYRQETLENDD